MRSSLIWMIFICILPIRVVLRWVELRRKSLWHKELGQKGPSLINLSRYVVWVYVKSKKSSRCNGSKKKLPLSGERIIHLCPSPSNPDDHDTIH